MKALIPLAIGSALALLFATNASAKADDDDPNGAAFFESKIRPVLVRECYECHSATAKALKGELRLDTKAGVLAGGEAGPAVVPGKPEESLILEALRHDGLAMPPRKKLSDAVIADFERWVKMGAPDPRQDAPAAAAAPSKRPEIDIEAGRKFWSYQLPKRSLAPKIADSSWPTSEIDRFILAALEAKGLRPGPDADREVLLRRLSFDLTGLPPTPEELDAFLSDHAPDAYERVVDRLLASPAFGERWGRHWLDVARFAESLTLRGFVQPNNWRYRDYVIDSFNRDAPFDRFIREQIAGDLLPATDWAQQRRQLIATAFLALGNTNLEEQDKEQLVMDVVDEQLDVIGKVFLGQTIGCARCHDHKFDPIPTRDYYAMAGVLRNAKALEHANVSKWLDRPLPVAPDQEHALQVQEKTIANLEAKLKTERDRLAKSQGGSAGSAKGALAASKLPGIVIDDLQARKVGEWKTSQHSGTYIGDGYSHDLDMGKGEKTLTFQPDLPQAGVYEIWLAYAPGGNRTESAPVTVFSADGEKVIAVNMKAAPPIQGRFVSLGRHRFEKNGQGFVLVSNEGSKGHVIADAVVFLPPSTTDQAPAASNPGLVSTPQPDPRSANASGGDRADDEAKTVARLEAELKRLRSNGLKRDLTMTVIEEKTIADARVHVRGSVHSLGEVAPRGVLRVASYGEPPAMPTNESGRRQLADWLASRDNPLTARVIVNRAWHWLFGAGLVRTADNFGSTGETPSHPEFLDALAVQFMDEGWSVKTLVRRIVLSRTYRLASDAQSPDQAKAQAADPENRGLWRANRRRLDAESLRDAMLSVSGQLRREPGGPSFPDDLAADYGFKAPHSRRSVYVPVFRNALPELFEAFDFADPSMVVGRRDASTVAPQALFLMNNPFVTEQARHAARRLLAEIPGGSASDSARVDRAHRLTLGRSPTDAERRLVLKFVSEAGSNEEAWASALQVLFASIDFRYAY